MNTTLPVVLIDEISDQMSGRGASAPQSNDLEAMQLILKQHDEFEAQIARKDTLLRAAYDLIKRSTQNHFVEETAAILVQYDGANCEGLVRSFVK
jgi:hypothetical protein